MNNLQYDDQVNTNLVDKNIKHTDNTIIPTNKIKGTQLKKQLLILFLCLTVSFVIMSISSLCSFICGYNPNTDLCWFITMGNGMKSGKIAYLDLYEQKGIILYFIFTLISIMFSNPYNGVFVLQIICFAIFLFFAYKIINRYVSTPMSILGIILTGTIAVTTSMFGSGGGSVEEYCLPIFSYLLYCFIEYIEDNKQFSLKRSFTIGLLLSIIFWCKYTILLLCIAPIMIYILLKIINKQYKHILKTIGFLTLGFLSLTLILLIYFIATKSLTSLLQIYFYDNLFRYGKSYTVLSNIKTLTIHNFINCIFVIIGLFCLKSKRSKLIYASWVLLNFIILLLLKPWTYYMMPFVLFSILGVAHLLKLLKKLKYQKVIALALLTPLVLSCCVVFSKNIKHFDLKKENYAPYQISEYIKTNYGENKTIISYKMLDYGFYNAYGIVAPVKYYALNNFEKSKHPEIYNQYEQYIKDKIADFIIINQSLLKEENEFILTYYTEEKSFNYYLDKDEYPNEPTFVLMKRI